MTTGRLVAEAHPGATSLGDRLVPFVPPVDTREFWPDAVSRRAARAELGFEDSAVVVGTVGNVTPMKGTTSSSPQPPSSTKSDPEVRFVILGAARIHAGHTERLRALANRLQLNDVSFVYRGRELPSLSRRWTSSG